MSKQAHQQVPGNAADIGPGDIPNQAFVERLGGRGAPDFIQAKLSGDQAYSSGAAIDFDTVVTSRSITVDGAGKFATLKAGRTYVLEASCKLTHSAAAEIQGQWYDVTGAVFIGLPGQWRTTTASSNNSQQAVAKAIFTPTVDTEVECRMLATGTAGSDLQATWSWATIMEQGGPGGLSGPMEHLETIEVGADVTSITFDGLDGDEDGEYVIDWYIPDAGAGLSVTLRPNGITVDQATGRSFGGASLGNSATADLLIYTTGAGGRIGVGSTKIDAASGKPRGFRTNSTLGNIPESTASIWVDQFAGLWDDTSTNITSLDVVSSIASGIKAGARLSLYRIKRTNASNIVARTVLTADASTLSLTGLDGDTDQEYEISGTLLLINSAHNLSVEPNGLTTSVRASRVNDGNAATGSTVGVLMVNGAVADHVVTFTGRIWAARTRHGVARHRSMRLDYTQAVSGDMNMGYLGVVQEDDSANLTSLDFTISVASGILAGSEVTVKRVDVG